MIQGLPISPGSGSRDDGYRMMHQATCKVTLPSLLALFFAFTAGVPAPAQNPNSRGIWISSEELKALPTSGAAWENLKSQADLTPNSPRISNQDDSENVRVMAR